MTKVRGHIVFNSPQSLDEVGRTLSGKIFGDVPFVGREESFYDEVPAVRLDWLILGFRVNLVGDAGGYALEIISMRSGHAKTMEEDIDLGNYIGEMLRELGWEVLSP